MKQYFRRAIRLDTRVVGGSLLLVIALALGLMVGLAPTATNAGPLPQGECPLSVSAEPPPAPSDLTCIPTSETAIALCWRDNSCNETGFRIERSEDGGPWHEIGSAPKNARTYLDQGLVPGVTYRYRVRGYRESDGQYSAYTNERACSVELADRLEPPDRTCENPPTFEWSPITGAITYTLQVATTPSFDPPLEVQVEVTSTSYTPAGIWPLGTYYWRVKGRNGCDESEWSSIWSVTLVTLPNPPELLSPPDGEITCERDLTLCWGEVPHATGYSLLVDDDPNLQSPLVELTGLSDRCVTLTTPLSPGRYYWSADAENECGRAMAAPREVIIEGPPGAPGLASPTDGAATCETRPAFSWSLPAGANTCCFQLDDDPDFSSPIVSECSLTSPYTPTLSLGPGTYYWRVRCSNDCGQGNWSQAYSFSVQGPPEPPVLREPADELETCDRTPTFSWSPVEDASCYSFQLAQDPDFTSPLIDESCVVTTTYTITSPLAPGTYYWRADASNECDRSWAEARQLTILPAPADAPTLVSPPDQASSCDDPPSFCWTLVPGATSYDVEIDGRVYTDQPGPCFTPAQRLGLGDHTWRVRAINVCGPGDWSPQRTIIIQEYETTCDNLICNGDFESEACWIDPPSCAPRYSTYKVHSGNRSILLGLPSWVPDTRCTSALWQPVTIPADATSAVLSFWYWPWSQDTIAYDWQMVQVRDADFNVVETLMLVNETSSGGDPWRHRAFDLSHYAGQTVYIYFAVRNDGVGGLRTFMYLDDVSLEVCQTRLCPVPSTAIAGKVTLQGRSDHSGAEVKVDGVPCDLTDEQGHFLCSVAPGPHMVSVSRCKYLTAETPVTVPWGTTVSLQDVFLRGGDINNNCEVDIFDVVALAAAYDTCPGDESCFSGDTNGDGCVDIRDMVIVGANFGLECPRPWTAMLALASTRASTRRAHLRLLPVAGDDGTARVEVWLEDVSGLYAGDLRLTFDPVTTEVIDSDRPLDGVQVRLGPELRGFGTLVVGADADNAAGTIRLAFTRLAPAPPLDGDVLLATVELEGSSELTLAGVELVDPSGHLLEWDGPGSDRLPFRIYLPIAGWPVR